MTRLRRISALVIVLAAAGCGDGDDDGGEAIPGPGASEQATSPGADAGSETSEAADASDGAQATPSAEIDAASMPASGDAQFEVEGTAYDFVAGDAAEGPAHSCAVSPTQIVVEMQLSPGALLVQASNPDGDKWLGNITISPPGSDRIYFSEPGFNGTFAVVGTMAQYDGEFFWRTSDDPASSEEAGVGTVRLSC
jgi:hypothetical protein